MQTLPKFNCFADTRDNDPRNRPVSVMYLAIHRVLVQRKRMSEEYIAFVKQANVIMGFVSTTNHQMSLPETLVNPFARLGIM